MNPTTIIFTIEEIAAIAEAYNRLSALAAKIQSAAPDAWAAVNGDFAAAAQAWVSTIDTPPVPGTAGVPTVQSLVERPGQLQGMPTGLADGFLAQAPGLTVTNISEMAATPAIAAPPAAATYGGDESGHVQDVTPHPPAP